MRKLLHFALGALLFAPASAFAEEAPKAEVFGAYSLFRPASPAYNLQGWNASVTGNLNDWFGIVGDFGGHYTSPEIRILSIPIPTGPERTFHSYLAGPQFAYRGSDRVTPFAHVLFGGARSSVGLFGFNRNSTAFATAFGGGIDIRLTDVIAIRAIQADYIMTRFGQESQNNARVSFGVVFRFGS